MKSIINLKGKYNERLVTIIDSSTPVTIYLKQKTEKTQTKVTSVDADGKSSKSITSTYGKKPKDYNGEISSISTELKTFLISKKFPVQDKKFLSLEDSDRINFSFESEKIIGKWVSGNNTRKAPVEITYSVKLTKANNGLSNELRWWTTIYRVSEYRKGIYKKYNRWKKAVLSHTNLLHAAMYHDGEVPEQCRKDILSDVIIKNKEGNQIPLDAILSKISYKKNTNYPDYDGCNNLLELKQKLPTIITQITPLIPEEQGDFKNISTNEYAKELDKLLFIKKSIYIGLADYLEDKVKLPSVEVKLELNSFKENLKKLTEKVIKNEPYCRGLIQSFLDTVKKEEQKNPQTPQKLAGQIHTKGSSLRREEKYKDKTLKFSGHLPIFLGDNEYVYIDINDWLNIADIDKKDQLGHLTKEAKKWNKLLENFSNPEFDVNEFDRKCPVNQFILQRATTGNNKYRDKLTYPHFLKKMKEIDFTEVASNLYSTTDKDKLPKDVSTVSWSSSKKYIDLLKNIVLHEEYNKKGLHLPLHYEDLLHIVNANNYSLLLEGLSPHSKLTEIYRSIFDGTYQNRFKNRFIHRWAYAEYLWFLVFVRAETLRHNEWHYLARFYLELLHSQVLEMDEVVTDKNHPNSPQVRDLDLRYLPRVGGVKASFNVFRNRAGSGNFRLVRSASEENDKTQNKNRNIYNRFVTITTLYYLTYYFFWYPIEEGEGTPKTTQLNNLVSLADNDQAITDLRTNLKEDMKGEKGWQALMKSIPLKNPINS